MSMMVAAFVFVPLLALAIARLVWASGGSWPIREKELLPAAVIGRPGVTEVPRLPALLWAVVFAIAGVLALALADHAGGGLPLTVLGIVAALAFLARGIIGYTAGWRERHPIEPFATLDRRNYSPLSLYLALGFAILVTMRLI